VKRIVPSGVKQVRKRLATGRVRVYWYHRATGERVTAEPGSAAAMVEVMDLDRKAEKLTPKARKTLADLWKLYRESPDFRRLKPRTQQDYDAVRSWIGPAATHVIPATMTQAQILKLRDKAYGEKGRRFSTYVVQVVRLVLGWGKERGWLGRHENPARGVKAIKKPKGEAHLNRAWTNAEVRNWFANAPAHHMLPVGLGLFAAMRQGDMIRVTPSAYDGEKIGWRAGKNDEWCEAPATGFLKLLLDAAPKGERLCLNARGEPWAHEGSFRSSFYAVVRDMQDRGLLGKGVTFHGLRHTVGAAARDGGASDFRVAAAIGDRSTAMAGVYGRDAARLAAQSAVLGDVQDKFADLKMIAAAVAMDANSIGTTVGGFQAVVDEPIDSA
jgi:integrase